MPDRRRQKPSVPEARRDLIVIGASAGGVGALQTIVRHLPADLPAAVLVVLHVARTVPSALPGILARAGRLPAAAARDDEPLQPGTIRVAPPDRHLVVDDGRTRLTRLAPENSHRPAIDPLFTSAAAAHGACVVGIVLSGMLDDGAAGLAAIAAAGGVTVVQDPDDALYGSMPTHAIAAVTPDHVVPANRIGGLIAELAGSPARSSPSLPGWLIGEAAASLPHEAPPGGDPLGAPGGQTCPTCGGALWESHEPGPLRFRCRVGHAWSADSLFAESAVHLEEALWTALRSLEERAALGRRLAAEARRGGNDLSAAQFAGSADDAERRARIVRAALEEREAGDGDTLEPLPTTQET